MVTILVTVMSELQAAGITLGSAVGAVTIGMFGDDPAVAMWTGAVLAVLAALVLATQTGARKKQPGEAVTVDWAVYREWISKMDLEL
ncbi:hypothetical protein ACIO87_38350 [Streptomyces sp. NPDC087218]|uniref:hypothetical protein n=1 Tax=Streptomyces sp. NPDC087218 TaxID=3365769 RepID=UPI003813DF7B